MFLILGTCWCYNGADLRPYLHPDYGKNQTMMTVIPTDPPTTLFNESTPLQNNSTEHTIPQKNESTITLTQYTQNTTSIKATTTISIEELTGDDNVNRGIKFQALSVVTVAAFLFISNIGWVALNQVICAELLPREIHRSANILIVSFSFLSAFISIKMFADLVQTLDAGHTFYLFGGICVFAALFTLLFVPETSQT